MARSSTSTSRGTVAGLVSRHRPISGTFAVRGRARCKASRSGSCSWASAQARPQAQRLVPGRDQHGVPTPGPGIRCSGVRHESVRLGPRVVVAEVVLRSRASRAIAEFQVEGAPLERPLRTVRRPAAPARPPPGPRSRYPPCSSRLDDLMRFCGSKRRRRLRSLRRHGSPASASALGAESTAAATSPPMLAGVFGALVDPSCRAPLAEAAARVPDGAEFPTSRACAAEYELWPGTPVCARCADAFTARLPRGLPRASQRPPRVRGSRRAHATTCSSSPASTSLARRGMRRVSSAAAPITTPTWSGRATAAAPGCWSRASARHGWRPPSTAVDRCARGDVTACAGPAGGAAHTSGRSAGAAAPRASIAMGARGAVSCGPRREAVVAGYRLHDLTRPMTRETIIALAQARRHDERYAVIKKRPLAAGVRTARISTCTCRTSFGTRIDARSSRPRRPASAQVDFTHFFGEALWSTHQHTLEAFGPETRGDSQPSVRGGRHRAHPRLDEPATIDAYIEEQTWVSPEGAPVAGRSRREKRRLRDVGHEHSTTLSGEELLRRGRPAADLADPPDPALERRLHHRGPDRAGGAEGPALMFSALPLRFPAAAAAPCARWRGNSSPQVRLTTPRDTYGRIRRHRRRANISCMKRELDSRSNRGVRVAPWALRDRCASRSSSPTTTARPHRAGSGAPRTRCLRHPYLYVDPTCIPTLVAA